ncbi:hypothetical protein GUJ93_ZPchr0013g34517 [Zizania palustris]|uniref:Uncharacterized protein n=1 Tax=Zizania palustris TaxID=103762 RepID=A0A8J5WZG7_ZIZPA|nr:hypothetical protein GUJ93_ZPchr0013g34517 [Zizania palustris]
MVYGKGGKGDDLCMETVLPESSIPIVNEKIFEMEIMNDEELAEKLQMDELAEQQKEPQNMIDEEGDRVGVKDPMEDVGKVSDGGICQDGDENTAWMEMNSGEGTGKIQITDSEDYVESQESVDFAARVGVIEPLQDKEPDEEDRRRCTRLKMKEDKSVLEMATSRKEAQNSFVDKAD